MITIFACPRAFSGKTGIDQRDAITSWTLLEPRPEIILFGDEMGTAEICNELGLRHIPQIARNKFGTPLVNDLFEKAQQSAAYNLMCFINADIIVTKNLNQAADIISKRWKRFVALCGSSDLAMAEIDFTSPDWQESLYKIVQKKGRPSRLLGMDLFLFSRGFYKNIPPFSIGRTSYDNWLIFKAWLACIPIIDITPFLLIMHLDHEKSTHCNIFLSTEETRANQNLTGRWARSFVGLDAAYILDHNGRLKKKSIAETLKPRIQTIKSYYLPNKLLQLIKHFQKMDKQARHHCPACLNRDVIDKGHLPLFHEKLFGGLPTPVDLRPGRLFNCLNCGLYFRYPCPDQSLLIDLYRQLPESVWHHKEKRVIWDKIIGLLKTYSANNTVLDVGCFNGDFLNYLDKAWDKLGIEPNISLHMIAKDRNIRIIGDTIEDVKNINKTIGAILLLDVLEHIPQPMIALQRLKYSLAPEGAIIIFTGATDALSWRIFGRHYWYSALPEHVVFFSLKWFYWAARELGMKVVYHKYLASEPAPRRQWLIQLTKLGIYTMVHRIRALGVPDSILRDIPLIKKILHWKTVPWWSSATDHILVVLAS